jgi:predicted anti-sigma-YlaC factor YlaD
MFCDEVLDVIEPIAAGELTPDGRVAAHLTTCPNCAAALVSARRVDQMLKARPVPKPAPQFSTRTMALVRRRRWKRDQFVDAGFNVALLIIGIGVVAAVWMALNRSGLIAVSSGTLDVLGAAVGVVRQRVPSSVGVYFAATLLLVTALGIWWWAERDTQKLN